VPGLARPRRTRKEVAPGRGVADHERALPDQLWSCVAVVVVVAVVVAKGHGKNAPKVVGQRQRAVGARVV
jgi:hypothetical protein